MVTVFTAIGECKMKKEDVFSYPVIYSGGMEHQVSTMEMKIWSKAANRIIIPQFYENGNEMPDYKNTLQRLKMRSLIASAEGETVEEACFILINSLLIKPINISLWRRLKDIFVLQLPIWEAVKILKPNKYSNFQKLILHIIQDHPTTASHIVDSFVYSEEKCMEPFKDMALAVESVVYQNVMKLYLNGRIYFDKNLI